MPKEMGMETTVKNRLTSRLGPLLVLVVLTLGAAREVTGQTPPAGEAVMAWPITIAPSWFDPSTAPPQITPFGILSAFHDASVRPLPGQKMAGARAERREAGSPAPPHPAAHARSRDVRADLEHASADRGWTSDRRSHDQSCSLVDLALL